MKKKVLFILGSLQSGGVTKSLLNLLSSIDQSKCELHLLVLSLEGAVFGDYVPKYVQLHYNEDIGDLHNGLKGSLRLLKRGKPMLAAASLVRMAASRVNRSFAGEMLATLMPRIEGKYDVIVDYGGQQQLYYAVKKFPSTKLITFFHNDYRKWPYYYKADKRYFAFAEKIYSVSPECVLALKEVFPEYANKMDLMENISSPRIIKNLAKKIIPEKLAGITFVTIGHIFYNKGTDYALTAAKIMKEKGVQFKWVFVGKVLEPKYVEMAQELGIDDSVSFVGIKRNPYPYMSAATIVVHTARLEGKSVALDEAKLLCKPIVVTNFSTVGDQFVNEKNALICDMNGESVARCLMRLLNDDTLRQNLVNNLENEIHDNTENVLKKFYETIL